MLRRFSSQFLGMNSSVVYDEGSAYVIDPGVFPKETRRILDFLAKENINEITVLLTHTHGDHIAGWYEFREYPIYGHECISEKSEDVRLNDVKYLKGMYRKQGIEEINHLKFPDNIQYLSEGTRRKIDPHSFIFFHVPGHSTDMSAIVIPEEKILFSGDMLILAPVPFILHSTRQYYQSLTKFSEIVEQYDLQCLVPGHGNLAKSKSEILERITNEKKYLENLVWKGLKLVRAGLTRAEIKKELTDATSPFTHSHAHQTNIQTILRELEDWLDEEVFLF